MGILPHGVIKFVNHHPCDQRSQLIEYSLLNQF